MKRLPIIGIGVGLVIGLLVLGSLYEPIPAHGATSSGTILVTTSSDTLANDGLCSLREAITAANTDTASRPAAGECAAGSGDDTILLPSGTFTLVRAGANEDSNLTGDLDLLSNVVLSGAGQGLTTLDGNQLDRVLHVHAGASVTVAQLAVQGGRAPDGADASYPVDGQPGSPGGGILSEGTLVIQYSTIRDSRAGDGGDGQGVGCMYWTDGGTGGDGGGIYAAGPLVLDGAVVTSNEAGNGGNTQRDLHEGPRGGHGGGIVAVDTLSVTDATISANVAGTGGHGCVGPGGVGGDGGGLWVSGTAHLGHSLVEANHAGQGQVGFQGGAGGSAGGLFQQGGTLTLTESAVRDNHAGEGGDGDGVDGGTGGHAGGLFVATSASASLEGTLFDSNHAGNGGYSDYTFPEPECDFYACGAGGNGGALAVEGVLMLARSTISGNRAGDGGYLAGTGTLSVGGDGGGLWIADNTSVQVADTTLTLNEAGLGGHDSGTPPQQGDPGRGGGFFGESELTNTIVAANLMNETDPSDC